MGRVEKRHDGLRVVGGDDFRVRHGSELHRPVPVFEQRFPPRRSSEYIVYNIVTYYLHPTSVHATQIFPRR